ERIAEQTYVLRLECPEVAAALTPGRFVMLRDPNTGGPLLGRPFAMFETWAGDRPAGHDTPDAFDIGYVTVGKLTGLMTAWKPGDRVDLWGPLGNGFPAFDGRDLVMVAGGIGQTPFLATARELAGQARYGRDGRPAVPPRMSLLYGVRTAGHLAGVDRFAAVDGLELRLATDDGSAGHHGYVTDILAAEFESGRRPDAVYCCGPGPMMGAVAALCRTVDITCYASLESPMACGFGACFSCVVPVKEPDGGTDYKRACVEGPVFRASELAETAFQH
ncbi:MAG: dihydroorotate dehydrogenase electron transfer subunit, partial [Planctomycetota bacterium]